MMVDLEELRTFATELPDGADTLVRDAIAELTHLRAKAAAGAKLRRVCDELPELTYFDDNPKERTSCLDCGAEIVFSGETRHGASCAVSLFKHALAEFDAAVAGK